MTKADEVLSPLAQLVVKPGRVGGILTLTSVERCTYLLSPEWISVIKDS